MASKFKVTVYQPSDISKREVLAALAHGVPGAWVVEEGARYIPCDIAVMFGIWDSNKKMTLEKAAILEQHKGRLLLVDQALVHRGEYWTVGWGQVDGARDYRTDGVRSDRWQGLGIKAEPWREKPRGPVVVVGQIPWGGNKGHAEWCRETVTWCVEHHLDVWFRPHPRIIDWRAHYPGIRADLVDQSPLSKTLHLARCIVTWDSYVGVEAAIAGVPVIACGPNSPAAPVALKRIDQYHRRVDFDRRAWLAGIGYSQWTMGEMQLGLPWKHLSRDL